MRRTRRAELAKTIEKRTNRQTGIPQQPKKKWKPWNKLNFAVPSPRKKKSSTWSASDVKDDGEDVDGDDDDDDFGDDNDSDNSHKVFAQLNGCIDA